MRNLYIHTYTYTYIYIHRDKFLSPLGLEPRTSQKPSPALYHLSRSQGLPPQGIDFIFVNSFLLFDQDVLIFYGGRISHPFLVPNYFLAMKSLFLINQKKKRNIIFSSNWNISNALIDMRRFALIK